MQFQLLSHLSADLIYGHKLLMWYKHFFHHMQVQLGKMEACNKGGLDASPPQTNSKHSNLNVSLVSISHTRNHRQH